jgi:dTDP-4-dehydrorhamnose 3,5-epimerase
MHLQRAPDEEIKLVRVTRGRIYDVILDLRRGSTSYLRWHALELSADNHLSLYIPKGVAHGFQTLEDQTELLYQMTHAYVPSKQSGVRWNDPAFGIKWPLPVTAISHEDANYANYEIEKHGQP